MGAGIERRKNEVPRTAVYAWLDAVPTGMHLGHLQWVSILTKLLSLKEVSELLGSKDPKGRMVRDLRTQGKLEAVKIGRNLMFTERSVSNYIDEQIRMQNKKARI